MRMASSRSVLIHVARRSSKSSELLYKTVKPDRLCTCPFSQNPVETEGAECSKYKWAVTTRQTHRRRRQEQREHGYITRTIRNEVHGGLRRVLGKRKRPHCSAGSRGRARTWHIAAERRRPPCSGHAGNPRAGAPRTSVAAWASNLARPRGTTLWQDPRGPRWPAHNKKPPPPKPRESRGGRAPRRVGERKTQIACRERAAF